MIQFILTLALSHNQTVIYKKHLLSGVFRVRALSSFCVSVATTSFQMICHAGFSHYDSTLCPGIIGHLFALRHCSHFSLNMLFFMLFDFSDLRFAMRMSPSRPKPFSHYEVECNCNRMKRMSGMNMNFQPCTCAITHDCSSTLASQSLLPILI